MLVIYPDRNLSSTGYRVRTRDIPLSGGKLDATAVQRCALVVSRH